MLLLYLQVYSPEVFQLVEKFRLIQNQITTTTTTITTKTTTGDKDLITSTTTTNVDNKHHTNKLNELTSDLHTIFDKYDSTHTTLPHRKRTKVVCFFNLSVFILIRSFPF